MTDNHNQIADEIADIMKFKKPAVGDSAAVTRALQCP